MGWHTLKRQKSAQKAALAAKEQQAHQQKVSTPKTERNGSLKLGSIRSSFKEKNIKNLSIQPPPSPVRHDQPFSSLNDKVQTLLARAAYDNHADAPDELNIRKGDIVTVIEKDIDGLTGWWLCLLHGEQGIVPGNRLQVIDPMQLDQLERKSASTKKRASYETDDNSDGHDALDGGAPNNYDYLPNPVKTPGFVPQLSIKDMFDIPLKGKSGKEQVEISQEVYDIPSSLNSTLDTTQEIYDIPSNRSSNRSSGNLNQSNSIPTGYDSPRTGRKEYDAGPTETYDVPSNLNQRSARKQHEGPTETYDVPSQLNRSRVEEPSETYDVPSNLNKRVSPKHIDGPTETYDVPSNLRKQAPPKQPEPYRVPNNIPAVSDEVYDVPKSRTSIDVDELMGEIMDSPFNEDPISSTIKRTPLNSNTSTPRGSFTSSNTGIDAADGPSQEIYDVPKKDVNGGRPPNTGRKNFHLQSPASNTMSHTLPRGFSPRSNNAKNLKNTPTRLQEIYNVPSSSVAATANAPLNRSTPGTPQSARKSKESYPTSQEIYDVPAPRNQDPTTNPEFIDMLKQLERTDNATSSNRSSFNSTHSSSKRASQELYDVPTSNPTSSRRSDPTAVSQYQNTQSEYRNTGIQQEIYDVPPSSHRSQEELYDVPPPRNTQTLGRSTKINRLSGGNDLNFIPPAQTSTPRGQEIYDTPQSSSRRRSPAPEQYKIPSYNKASRNDGPSEIYDVPTNNKNSSQQEIYDVPSAHDVDRVMADAYGSHKTTRNHNNNLLTPQLPVDDDDYVDYHDIWSKQPPKELMRQHAKSISGRPNSRPPSGGGSPLSFAQKRLSTGSTESGGKKSVLDQINFEAVKELQLTVSEAVERLGKLHLAVDTCVQTLKMFQDENWLEISSLNSHIHSIRDFSGKLKTALRLLTEFGLGTLVNTTNNINGEALMDKIIDDVEPLLESYYKVKICLMHLDSNNWAVPASRNSTTDKFFATLNAIMILAQRIPDQCRSFTLAVKNNASELFTPDPVEDLTKHVKEMDIKRQQQPLQKIQLLTEPTMSAEALRKELAGRRQQARDSTLRPVPRIPPKPTLPHQRRSLAGSMDPPDNPRYSLANRAGYGHIERLVTEYQPENSKQKKYASDPTTPSHTTSENKMWGGSCPVLLDRNSAAAATPLHNAESMSSSSSVGASIPEETIEIKKTDIGTNKNFPSDSNLISPVLTPLHTRSASLPWDDKLKNVFSFEDNGPKSPNAISPLDHRDIESLEFFCRQVESQVLLLRESMKNLTEAVENQEEPVVFVSHSKFIILTAHKVVHSGQEISERLIHTDIKSKIKEHTTHLTVCIRGVVSATKTAALEYPETTALMEMISSVLALGDAVRIIHRECRQALNA
ncbi:breast cancer anti-estrogen resistance protein 1-like isoform X1 [Clytia hemisphaerica]|uniref:SH3 domain-containing protein n=1 Tax=Clytia hemisphaerica TaxID=252671 RepID=A0A7M5V8M1_9CNID